MADTNTTYVEAEEEIGHGSKIYYGETANGDYTKVPGTFEWNFPESELGKGEVTNDDSADYHKDYIPGMYEPGTTGFKYRYGKTAFAALHTLYMLATGTPTQRATATKYWKIITPDGSTAKFRGFLTKHGMSGNQEDPLEVEAEMQVRGKMTFTPAA